MFGFGPFFPGEAVRARGFNRAYPVGTSVRVRAAGQWTAWGKAHVWVTAVEGGAEIPVEMSRVEGRP